MSFRQNVRMGLALFAAFMRMQSVPAHAQISTVSTVGPFQGTLTETWESFPNYLQSASGVLDNPTALLGGGASLSNAQMIIYEPGVANLFLGFSGIAQVADGSKGMAIGSLEPTATIDFVTPVVDFGAYWGTETFGTPGSVSLRFYDGAGTLLDTASFGYERPGDGLLEWHGWHFSAPIQRLSYTGNTVAIDGLQANVVPEPGALSFGASALLIRILAGWLLPSGGLVSKRRASSQEKRPAAWKKPKNPLRSGLRSRSAYT